MEGFTLTGKRKGTGEKLFAGNPSLQKCAVCKGEICP